MATTPEGKFKTRIQRETKKIVDERKLPVILIWNAGARYGVPRVDCDGVVAGWAVAIEVKRPDGKGSPPTARQLITLRDYRLAGARVFQIVDEDSLQHWLAWLRLVPMRRGLICPE